MQFLLYAADVAAPDYCVVLLSLDHAEGRILFWLLLLSVYVLSHFGFYKNA